MNYGPQRFSWIHFRLSHPRFLERWRLRGSEYRQGLEPTFYFYISLRLLPSHRLLHRWSWSSHYIGCLDHLISLTVDDKAFEAESAKNVQSIFWVTVPTGKKRLTMKWRRSVLDRPVFREPIRSVGESGTSPSEPLRASTWIRYLQRLGRTVGFQFPFTQYGLRHGFLNVVDCTSTLFIDFDLLSRGDPVTANL